MRPVFALTLIERTTEAENPCMADKVLNYAAGATVIRDKQPCEAIYVVKEGQLQACKVDANGRAIPFGIINSGEFIGEMAYFLDTHHTSTVIALTPVTLAKIPKNVLDRQLRSTPKWMIALTRNLIKRLKQANDVLVRNKISDEKLVSMIRAIETKNRAS